MSDIPLPPKVLKRKIESEPLSNILDEYSPDSQAKKYRKPNYQRCLKKPDEWCRSLVDSILKRESIGALHLSKWQMIDKGKICLYFNIEDGQTRLDACMRFRNGDFKSTYGPYSNKDIAVNFDTYHVPTITMEKVNDDITDEEYFNALINNFSNLQEGTALNANARYIVHIKDPNMGYIGSPIVNLTIDVVDEYKTEFSKYFGIQSTTRTVLNKKLALLVAIVSGAMDLRYANNSYYKHVGMLEKIISDKDQKLIRSNLGKVFSAIESAIKIKPKFHNEKLNTLTSNIPIFIGPMLAAYHNNQEEDIEVWARFLNDLRHDKATKKVIFENLEDGAIRNCSESDFENKMEVVRDKYKLPEKPRDDEEARAREVVPDHPQEAVPPEKDELFDDVSFEGVDYRVKGSTLFSANYEIIGNWDTTNLIATFSNKDALISHNEHRTPDDE